MLCASWVSGLYLRKKKTSRYWLQIGILTRRINTALVWRELLTLAVSGAILSRALCSAVRSCAEMCAVWGQISDDVTDLLTDSWQFLMGFTSGDLISTANKLSGCFSEGVQMWPTCPTSFSERVVFEGIIYHLAVLCGESPGSLKSHRKEHLCRHQIIAQVTQCWLLPAQAIRGSGVCRTCLCVQVNRMVHCTGSDPGHGNPIVLELHWQVSFKQTFPKHQIQVSENLKEQSLENIH